MKYRDQLPQREYARRSRAERVEPGRGTLGPLLDAETRLLTAQDVLAVIESQVAAVLNDDELSTAERAPGDRDPRRRGAAGD